MSHAVRNPMQGSTFVDRADSADALRNCLNPLLPYLSPASARLRLGPGVAHYGPVATEMEGVCRPLWGLAPLLSGGGTWDGAERWFSGVHAGVDERSPEFWGRPGDHDQRWVEAAAIGFTLLISPESLTDTPAPMDRLVGWLQGINGSELHPNNWLFFRVLVNLGLRKIGADWDSTRVAHDLEQLESFADPAGGESHGWFSDGNAKQRDYYIPWAIHFYSLLVTHWAEDACQDFAARAKDRAIRFADDFEHWFADDGSALPFGRSLTYRTAQCAFWPALAMVAGDDAIAARSARLWSNNMRWWSAQPIAHDDGVMSIGYAYPSQIMGEQYNSPTSPYWALKAFLPLAAGDTHAFWEAQRDAERVPGLLADRVSVQRGARMALVRNGGDVIGYPAEQASGSRHRHGAAKYAKFAYSTRFGFCTPAGNEHITDLAPDNALALSEDGSWWRTRHHQERGGMTEGGCVWSDWMPWDDVRVRSWVVPCGAWHVRVHRIESARALECVEGGWSCPCPGTIHEPSAGHEGGMAWSRGESYHSLIAADDGRQGTVIRNLPSQNVLFPLADIPAVSGRCVAGTTVLTTLVAGSAAAIDADQAPRVTIEGDEVRIEAFDGSVRHGFNVLSTDGDFNVVKGLR